MQFGEVVACYLEEQGLTQSDLARRMNTGRSTINSMIIGKRRGPRLDTAVEVAEALGVPLQEMVERMKED